MIARWRSSQATKVLNSGKLRLFTTEPTSNEVGSVEIVKKCNFLQRNTLSTVLSELKACTASRDLRKGRILHESAIRSADISDVYVANSLVNMYAKCGCMRDAQGIFDSMQRHNVVSWTTLMLGYADNGEGGKVLALFETMVNQGCEPNSRVFVAVLKSCFYLPSRDQFTKVKYLHSFASKTGLDLNIFVQATLVDMYAKCGSMEDARQVFDGMKQCNVVSWNSIIFGCVDNGEVFGALQMFSRMRSEGFAPDSRTFVAILKSCVVNDGCLELGKKLHMLTVRTGNDVDIYVNGILIDMYAKYGCMEIARRVFERIKDANVVSWNTLILGYVDNGNSEMALGLFSKMRSEGFIPNSRTIVAALKACSELAGDEDADDLVKEISRNRGKVLHLFASTTGCEADVYVLDTLVDLYGKCGNMKDARIVFDQINPRNVVCWTALILGYADNGEGWLALQLLSRMKQEEFEPNAITFVAALKACIDMTLREDADVRLARDIGKKVHMLALKSACRWHSRLEGTLVDMYAKCGSMEDARLVFDSIRRPDVVSWTALILGYADNGKGEIALDLFSRMRREGCEPNARTFSAALKAGGKLGALEFGKAVHAEVCDTEFAIDKVLGNCLVDIYAKCGKLAEAEQVFDSQETRDLVAWNTLMTGYGRHGSPQNVFVLFDRMCDTGFVQRGMDYHILMSAKYGIIPTIDHCNCLLDMLGRANKLEEAMALLRNMAPCPDGVTWVTILGACRKWRNTELGNLAFESLMCLDGNCGTAYVQMASIYENRITQKTATC